MPVIAIQGIRGGCGATTVAAGLAAALQSLNYP
ncbi:MAG: cellulose synthase operon protein YhjQ/BcsQ, partial [Plesiomonas sp.]